MKWERLFREHIRDRGYGYFLDNSVEDLVIEGDSIHAVVWGTEAYEVQIDFSGRQIIGMHCSCPYAESGENCKHMAAVLYSWEEKESLFIKTNNCAEMSGFNHSEDSGESETLSVEEVVSKADEKIVREFLADLLRKDNQLLLQFKSFAGQKFGSEDIVRFKIRIDEIIEDMMERKDFNFRHHYDLDDSYYDFIGALESFFYNDLNLLMNNGSIAQAFDMICYLFEEVSNLYEDEYYEELHGGEKFCIKAWNEILKKSDASLKDFAYEWFERQRERFSGMHEEEYLEDIMFNGFEDEPFSGKNLKYAKERLNEAKVQKADWEINRSVEKWAMRCAEITGKRQECFEDFERHCADHWEYISIRKFYIQRCMELHDYRKAISALEETLKDKKISYSERHELSVTLKEAYLLSGDINSWKNQLKILICEGGYRCMEYYRELKGSYAENESEWIAVREEIMSELYGKPAVHQLYSEEGMHERLITSVLSFPTIDYVRQYRFELGDLYPALILNKYEEELREISTEAAGRKAYRYWMSYLREMLELQGGTARVLKIAAEWKAVYKNRSAMMDELNRLLASIELYNLK